MDGMRNSLNKKSLSRRQVKVVKDKNSSTTSRSTKRKRWKTRWYSPRQSHTSSTSNTTNDS